MKVYFNLKLINIKFISFLISMLFLSACSEIDYTAMDSNGTDNCSYYSESCDQNSYKPKNMSDNENKLLSLGSEVHQKIDDMDKIERYKKTRIIKVVDEKMAKYGLGARVQIDWTGPVEPLMREVAGYADYKLKVIGVPPAIPVIVTAFHDDVELGDIIREAHLQAKERADVVVYPKSKVIEIRYFELS